MENKYDVIIVGAGNGGLMAAARCARAGLKTLVIEKNNMPGGCAASFVRGRFEFEASLHELCSVGTKENPDSVYRWFEEFEAGIDWKYENNLFRVIADTDEGFDVTVKAGAEEFCRSIEEKVPGSYDSVKRLLKVGESCEMALDYINSCHGEANALVMLTRYSDFLKAASHSFSEICDSLGVPVKAQRIIGSYWVYLGVPTSELNAMHFLNMLYNYVTEGAAMPSARSCELALALERTVREAGGEFLYNTRVTGFLYGPDGAVRGVEAEGREYLSRAVVSNLMPDEVYALSPDVGVPEREKKLAAAREQGLTFVTAYIGLDISAEEAGLKDYSVFIARDPDPAVQYDKLKELYLYCVNCLNIVIPDCSPEGTCMIFLTVPQRTEDFPGQLTAEEYRAYKTDIVRRCLEDFDGRMGTSILAHIEEIETASPVTFADYLGTPGGCVYGYRVSRWDNIMSRIRNEQREFTVPGLFYCGGHSVKGDGFNTSLSTGNTTGLRTVGYIRRLKAAEDKD